jgi:site-specific recombinase XerD
LDTLTGVCGPRDAGYSGPKHANCVLGSYPSGVPYSSLRRPLPAAWQPLWEGFERHLRIQGRRDRTLNGYQESLAKLAEDLKERGPLPDVLQVGRRQIEDFVLDLQQAGHAPNTVLRHFRGLATFFNWLVEEDLLETSPLARLRPPMVKTDPPPVLSDEAITSLLRACAGRDFEARRDTALVRFLVDTGCRRSELESMTVDGTDTKTGTAVVTGKTGTRVVSIGTRTAQALWRYLLARQRLPKREEPWLWLRSRGGGRLLGNGMYQALRRRAREASLEERVFLHLFRHTSTHLALSNGANERDVITLNGWTSGAMLARYGASAAQERAIAAHKRFSPGDRF